jgi:hypothetical protein
MRHLYALREAWVRHHHHHDDTNDETNDATNVKTTDCHGDHAALDDDHVEDRLEFDLVIDKDTFEATPMWWSLDENGQDGHVYNDDDASVDPQRKPQRTQKYPTRQARPHLSRRTHLTSVPQELHALLERIFLNEKQEISVTECLLALCWATDPQEILAPCHGHLSPFSRGLAKAYRLLRTWPRAKERHAVGHRHIQCQPHDVTIILRKLILHVHPGMQEQDVQHVCDQWTLWQRKTTTHRENQSMQHTTSQNMHDRETNDDSHDCAFETGTMNDNNTLHDVDEHENENENALRRSFLLFCAENEPTLEAHWTFHNIYEHLIPM